MSASTELARKIPHWKIQQAECALDKLLEAALDYDDVMAYADAGSDLVYPGKLTDLRDRVLRLARAAAKATRTAASDPEVGIPARRP